MPCNAWRRIHPNPQPMPRCRLRLLQMLLCATALSACGGESGSMLDRLHAQPPIPAAPGHSAPLGASDIALYLQVMREAAQRVQHPTGAEKQMLARADAITAAANRGDVSLMPADSTALEDALAFHMQMDLQVARAHRLDVVHYQALSERIEDEAGQLYCSTSAAVPDPALKPHVAEIERLVGIVRNPGPTGSAPVPPVCADGNPGAQY